MKKLIKQILKEGSQFHFIDKLKGYGFYKKNCNTICYEYSIEYIIDNRNKM